MQARKGWQEIFKVMKSKDLQLRLLYPAKLHLKSKDIKSFPEKKQLKFTTTKQYCMTHEKVFFKKKGEKKIENMNNKMAINAYSPTIGPKNQNK